MAITDGVNRSLGGNSGRLFAIQSLNLPLGYHGKDDETVRNIYKIKKRA